MIDNLNSIDAKNLKESYQTASRGYSVQGTVLWTEGQQVAIEMEDGNIAKIETKEKQDFVQGQEVSIPKKEIKSMKISNSAESKAEDDIYSNILKREGIEQSRGNLELAIKLEEQGLPITKENLEKFKKALEYMGEIEASLDYSMAMKLNEKGINPYEVPLEELVQAIREVKGTVNVSEPKSIIDRLFDKTNKEMTWDQAREIAKELYGNTMGKDILDIIKSCSKDGIDITKNLVDDVHDFFSKLWNVQDAGMQVFSDALKNNMGFSIDSLYSVKNYVTKSSVEIPLESKDIPRSYESNGFSIDKMKSLGENIKRHLENIGIEPKDENVRMAQVLISRGLEITTQKLDDLKSGMTSLKVVKEESNIRNIAKFVSLKLEPGRMDIRELANKIMIPEEVEKPETSNISSFKETEIFKEEDPKEVLFFLKDFKGSKDEAIGEIIKNSRAFSLGEMKKIQDLLKNKRGLGNILEETALQLNASKDIDLKNTGNQLRQNMASLPKAMEEGKDELKDAYIKLYSVFKEVEKSADQKREKTSVIEEMSKELRDSKETQTRMKDEDIFVQLPFSFGQEGRNATVLIKSPKNKKDNIDPKDMELIVNIQDLKGEPVVLDIKVKDDNIKLKINGGEVAKKRFERDISKLEDYLSQAGYKLETGIEKNEIEKDEKKVYRGGFDITI